MNRENENSKYGNGTLLNKVNRIDCTEVVSTNWRIDAENNHSDDIWSQNYNGANDITTVEESFDQEIEVSSNANQTDYTIVEHKYSKEAIKPYFLHYFNIKESPSIHATDSIELNECLSANSVEKLYKEYCDTNDFKKVDIEISTTALHSKQLRLTDKLDLIQIAEQIPDKSTPTDKIKPFWIQEECGRNSCPSLYKSNYLQLTESENLILVDRDICSRLLHSFIIDPVKDLFCPSYTMTVTPEECSNIKDFPPTEIENSFKKKPPPPEPPEPPLETNDSVYVVCMKDDVHFKLRCKKKGGSGANLSLGDETKYECQIIPDPNVRIDKETLESCDLKCKLCKQNSNTTVKPYNVKFNQSDDNNYSPMESKNSVISTNIQSDSVMRIVIKTGCGSESKTSVVSEPSSEPSSESKSKRKIPCSKRVLPDSAEGIKICPPPCTLPCIYDDKLKFPQKKKGTDENKDCQSTTIVIYQEELGNSPSATRTYTKPENIAPVPKTATPCIDAPKTKKNNGCACARAPNLFSEITDAMVRAHNRTVATLKNVAEDLVGNVSKASKKSTDPNTSQKIQKSVEEFVCDLHNKAVNGELQKSAEDLGKCGFETIKEVSKFTRNKIKEIEQHCRELANNYKDEDDEDACESKPPRKVNHENMTSFFEKESYSSFEIINELKSSVENFYDTVCKTAQEVTDIARNSVTIFGLENDEPSNRASPPVKRYALINPGKKFRYPADTLVYDPKTAKPTIQDIEAEERLNKMRHTAQKVCEKMRKTAFDIKESTTEIAVTSKKLITNEDQILRQKGENLKQMITGLRFFEQKSLSNIENDRQIKSSDTNVRENTSEKALFGMKQYKDIVDGKPVYSLELFKSPSEEEVGPKKSDRQIKSSDTNVRENTSKKGLFGMKQFKDTVDGKPVYSLELFKSPSEEEVAKKSEEKVELPTRGWSHSIRSSMTALSKIEIGEKSSPYDVPRPSKRAETNESAGGVSGMFTTIKNKFFSIFYERQSLRTGFPNSYSYSSVESSEDDKSVLNHSKD